MKQFLLVLTAVIALLTFPATAFSSKPEVKPQVSGEVNCGGYANRHQIITWTVANSETIIMLNTETDPGDTAQGRTMILDQISVSSGWVDGIEVRMKFPPRPQENSVRTAYTDLPGDQVGNVDLHVRADWKGETSPQDVPGWAQVHLDGNCVIHNGGDHGVLEPQSPAAS